MTLIADLHLDLAMNAIEWNRDLTRPVAELRQRERGRADKPDRGRGTVSLPDMRRGGVGLCVATQIARVEREAWSPVFGWHSPAQAWAMTQAQLAWYRAMEEAGELVQIRDRAGLERHLARWDGAGPIGYVLSLEGADSLSTPAHLERAYAQGLRAIGPAHYGPGAYAMGTNAEGGLPRAGRELLREVARLGLILDLERMARPALCREGDLLLLIGAAPDDGWLGQSLYLRELIGREDGAPPPVDLLAERRAGDLVGAHPAQAAAHGLGEGHGAAKGETLDV